MRVQHTPTGRAIPSWKRASEIVRSCDKQLRKEFGWKSARYKWAEQINAVRCGWRVVGGSAKMRELAQKIGQHRFKRRSRRPGESTSRIESG
jgi:hypothetical protein